jgi:hypothetical protein
MKRIYLMFVLFSFFVGNNFGQEIFKVKKEKKHNIIATKILTLEINLKSANIHISNWDKNEIEIIEENEASNTDKTKASKDLEMIKSNFGFSDNTKEQYLITNQITAPNIKTLPGSKLITHLTIKLPSRIHIQINQHIGKLHLDQISNPMNITGQLIQTKIIKSVISGQINQNFGSLNITNSQLNAKILTNNVVTNFESNRGLCDLKFSKNKCTFLLNGDDIKLKGAINDTELDVLVQNGDKLHLFISGGNNKWKISTNLEKSYYKPVGFQTPLATKEFRINATNSIIKILNF